MKYEEYTKGNGSIRQRNASEIENDVEAIRAEMSETLRRIEERFSPRELLHQLTGSARTFGGGSAEMAKNLGATVRDNPVPLLLIGTGVVTLLFSQRSDHAGRTAEHTGEARAKVGEARAKMGEARAKMGEASHRASAKASELRGKASDVGHRARDAARDAQQRGRDIFQEQPLVVIGLGLVAGALLGSAMPVTERERQVVGPKRDRLVGHAKEAAHQAREGLQPSGREARPPEDVRVQPTVGVSGGSPVIGGQGRPPGGRGI